MEKQIKIAERIYKCRDTAKKLFQEEFPERIKWYKDFIIDYQKKSGKDVLPAVMDICNLPSMKESEMAHMLFIAAAAEILEPSKK